MMETNEINPLDPQEWVEPPSEFDAEGTPDLAAYWESASPATAKRGEIYGSPPVTFTPLYVTLTDSDLDPRKSSTLLHCRLEAPCLLKSATRDEGYVEFPAGTFFGIWTKPGMKALKERAGVKCWMRNGQKVRNEIQYFKDISKPGDKTERTMVVFDIRWAKDAPRKYLEVRDDHRNESLPDAEQQRRERRAAKAAERANARDNDDGDEFIPF